MEPSGEEVVEVCVGVAPAASAAAVPAAAAAAGRLIVGVEPAEADGVDVGVLPSCVPASAAAAPAAAAAPMAPAPPLPKAAGASVGAPAVAGVLAVVAVVAVVGVAAADVGIVRAFEAVPMSRGPPPFVGDSVPATSFLHGRSWFYVTSLQSGCFCMHQSV